MSDTGDYIESFNRAPKECIEAGKDREWRFDCFTQEDVVNLRWAIEDTLITNRDILRELHSLADRIEARLPPGKP
jgi:hypothetical protein